MHLGFYSLSLVQTILSFATFFLGCGGNGNNYASKSSCEKRCAPLTNAFKCHLGKEPLKGNSGDLTDCSKTPCPRGYKCSTVQQSSICCPDVEKFKGSNTCFDLWGF